MEDNENQNQVTEPTSEENSNEVKTYTLEEVETMKNQMKAEYEKTFDEKFNKRWGKEKARLEKSKAKEEQLVNLLKQQTGKNSIDELLDYSYQTYGVEKPEETMDNEDVEFLGKYKDAKAILDSNDTSEIEFEANRLAEIPNRNAREQATFMELAGYLNTKKLEEKRKKEIKDAGIDEEILKNNDFTDFLGKFNDKTPISDVYKIYKSMNQKEKPFSTGSLKDTKSKGGDLFTLEEFLALTADDLKNPVIYEKALKSKKYFK